MAQFSNNVEVEAQTEFSPELEVGANVVVGTEQGICMLGTITQVLTHEGQEYYRIEEKDHVEGKLGDYRDLRPQHLARVFAMDDPALPDGSIQVGGRVVMRTGMSVSIMGTIGDVHQREDGETSYKFVAGDGDYRWIGADSLLLVLRANNEGESKDK